MRANLKSQDTRKPCLTSKNHQRPSGHTFSQPNISTTELKPSSLEKNQHYVSQKKPWANVKACWGKETIWAILSNLWNHEFSVLSTSSWPESAAIRSWSWEKNRWCNKIRTKYVPVKEDSCSGPESNCGETRRRTCQMPPTFPNWLTSAGGSGQQPSWADEWLVHGYRRCLCS